MAGVVKELSDRIAAVAPSIDDGDSALRLLRTETDNIHYEDTDSNSLDGDRSASDNVEYTANNATFTAPDQFRVPGGDFLTFHIQADSPKLRDFVGGEGGFYTGDKTRAYVRFSESS